MTEPTEQTEQTDLVEQDHAAGYTLGGTAPYMPSATGLIEAAMKLIKTEDVAGQALSATSLKESAFFGHGGFNVQLAREDRGWQLLSTANNLDMSPQMRMHNVWRARQFSRFDSLCKQTLALYTNFGIGTGFKWSVINKDGSADRAAALLTETQRTNPKTFKMKAQRDASDAAYTDGEMFFVLFFKSDGVLIRTLDPLEITHVVTHPEDKATPIFYVRRFMVNDKEVVRRYADWQWNGSIDVAGLPKLPGVRSNAQISDGVVYHVKFRGRGKRGESGLTSDMDWSAQYRRFMTARAAITLAIAAFAYDLKVKGNQGNINAIKAQLGTSLSTTTGTGETNPPPAPASTFLSNEGANLAPMKQETGAAAAKVDAGLFVGMAGLGSGIFPHYYGIDNSFRLATASSMEPPMMKTFEAWQGLWVDVYETLIRGIWDRLGVPEDEQNLNTTVSPIQEINKTGLIDSIQKMVATFPKLGDSDDLIKWGLAVLGMNDADELLKALEMDDDDTPPSTREAVMQHFASLLREAAIQAGKGDQHETT